MKAITLCINGDMNKEMNETEVSPDLYPNKNKTLECQSQDSDQWQKEKICKCKKKKKPEIQRTNYSSIRLQLLYQNEFQMGQKFNVGYITSKTL